MIALEQARQYLESLGLQQAVEVLDNTLDTAARKQLTYPEMLEQLLGTEVEAGRERYLSTRTKMAHFPFQRTLEQLDFAFQPSIDERQVKELAFVAEATNILTLGPPGVGTTHLAVALARRAIERGYGAYFVRAYDLLEGLIQRWGIPLALYDDRHGVFKFSGKPRTSSRRWKPPTSAGPWWNWAYSRSSPARLRPRAGWNAWRGPFRTGW